ncbi:MAG: DUF1801 domain-containing protein [Gemmatimonadota bacterium]|nr:DUF1801 domain-containing protein [Gemmatimonadota bacterium]MDH5197115.1 DUF1801 domain-containing protein [Gemmatimonadota bacterium]
MTAVKTARTTASVNRFLKTITDERRRADCLAVLRIMKRVTRTDPAMWGTSIVGFGSYRYRYASGREGDWPITGFSPRKQALTVYVMTGFKRYPQLMEKLGKHSTGSSCLYIKHLEDVDLVVLEDLIRESVHHLKETYG